MKAMRRGSRWTQILGSAGRWGALVLAAFYLNFVSVHLATATHFHSQGEEHSHSHTHSDTAEADHDHGEDQDHHADEHAPHDASEHLLDVALKGADPMLAGPALVIVSETFSFDAPVFFVWTQRVFERERPPGEAFPDPQQPRAPPLA